MVCYEIGSTIPPVYDLFEVTPRRGISPTLRKIISTLSLIKLWALANMSLEFEKNPL